MLERMIIEFFLDILCIMPADLLIRDYTCFTLSVTEKLDNLANLVNHPSL